MPVRLFTAEQVANILGATPSTVDDWMRRGWLPYQRLPSGPLRVSERGLLKFLKDRGVDIGEIAEKIAREEARQEGRYVSERGPERAEPQATLADRSDDEPAVTPAEIAIARRRQREQAETPAEVAARHLARIAAQARRSEADQARPTEAPTGPVAEVVDDAEPEQPRPSLDLFVGPKAEQAQQAPPAAEGPPEAPGEEPSEPAGEAPPGPPAQPAPKPPPEPAPKPPPSGRTEPKPPSPRAADGRARQIAEAILASAVSAGATDIYIQPAPDGLHLQMRIDGVVRQRPSFRKRLPEGVAGELTAYLSSLAGSAESDRPIEGRFTRTIEGRNVRFHISAWPTLHGQAFALTVADTARAVVEMSRLGLDERDEQRLGRLLASPAGLIVVADPSGEGIDVLRPMARSLSSAERQIVTIERFADMEIPGAAQARIDPAGGFGFAEASRFLAGLGPDVLLVGDLRDPATARAACAAAEGRTMVLAGMKADSAHAAVATLLEMGLDPWPLSNSLLAAVAKVTFRMLCANCKKPARKRAEVAERNKLLADLNLTRKELGCTPMGARGCAECSQTGYRGRTGAFSVLYVAGDVSRLLRGGPSAGALAEAAALAGTKTLLSAGLEKLRAGETSLEEIARKMTALAPA